jgi:Zn-finger nucleic acid-binding protein
MPELAPRYPCPVCLGVTMEKVRIGESAPVEVDHCRRCGGVWFEYGEVSRLRAHPSDALWSQIARRGEEAVTPCHDCHAPFARSLEACPACGCGNVLDCPSCDRPMHRESRAGLHLDVCRACRGAWFDHGELDGIWNEQAAVALGRRPATAPLARTGEAAGDVLLDVLWFAPDLAVHGVVGAAHLASGIGHAAAHIPELAGAAPEAAIVMVEVAGEAAGSVFEIIVGILEGLFG